MVRTIFKWLSLSAAEGVWQGWTAAALGGATVTALREWMRVNIGLSIFLGILVAYVFGMGVQLVAALRKRRNRQLLNCNVLSDAAASLENMRDVFSSTVDTFDCLAVSGGTLVRKWIPQIEDCAQRGVRFRFLFADMNDPHCQVFARSIKKDPALLKAETDDVILTLDGIKKRVKSAKIEHLFYAGHSPLYSMWIRDKAGTGESNIQVHLYGGLGNGPIVRGRSPELHRALSAEFDEAWRLGKP